MARIPVNRLGSFGLAGAWLALTAGCGGGVPAGTPETSPAPVVPVSPAADPCLAAAVDSVFRDTVIVALSQAETERFIAAHEADHPTAVDCEGASRSSLLPAFRRSGENPVTLTPLDPLRAGWAIRIRTAEPAADARDLIDRGADVVITADPAALEYARRRTDLRLVPLAWSTTYLLATPPDSPPPAPAAPEGLRAELARDVVRAEARPAAGPEWWNSDQSCRAPPPRPAGGSRRNAVAILRGDPTARALGERMVVLLGRENPSIRLAEHAPSEFAAALAGGTAAAFIVPHPRFQPLMPDCPGVHRIPAGSTVFPLIDTRPTAVLRSGVPAFRMQGDGSIRFLPSAP